MSSIGVILASVREPRRGEAFATWILAKLAERAGVAAELIDLKEWRIPAYEHGVSPLVVEKSYAEGTLSHRWAEKVRSLDGFVIVTPEYNHGYPGQLKHALDHVYLPWGYKPVAFVGYGGFSAGTRAVQQLRQVAIELRMVPLRDEVSLSLIGLAVDDKGWPTNERQAQRAATMIDELVWWAGVMKEARGKRG